MRVRVAVFASGGGTNLQALLDGLNGSDASPAEVVVVVSDRADAGALTRARSAGVAVKVVPVSGRPAEDVAAAMVDVLAEAGVELIALAGYLRLIPAAVVERWRGRILNIHPALLPAFGGKGMYGHHVHRAVLAAGCLVSGATVHLVTERYDEGKPIVQWPVPVLRGDTAETLAARVLQVEHVLYPFAVEVAARALRAGLDLVEVLQMAWGSRSWGFDADAGGFVWDEEGVGPGAVLRGLIGIDAEEES